MTRAGPYIDLLATTSGGTAATQASGTPFWGDEPDAWDSFWLAKIRLPGLVELDGSGFTRRVDKKKTAGRNGASVTHTGMEAADIDVTLLMWTPEHLADFAALIQRIKPRKASTSTETKTIRAKDKMFAAYSEGFGGLRGGRQGQLDSTHESGGARGFGGVGFGQFSQKLRVSSGRDRKETKVVTTPASGMDPWDVYHPALALFGIGKVFVLSCSLPEPVGDKRDRWKAKLKCLEFVGESAAKGNVVTPKKATRSITDFGAGALGERLQKPTPADDNTGP